MHTESRNRAGGRPDLSSVRTVQQYAAQAIARTELTRAAAQAAMEKATRPDVRELAGYEIDAIAGGCGGWGEPPCYPPTGFGAKTDARLAWQRSLEANFHG